MKRLFCLIGILLLIVTLSAGQAEAKETMTVTDMGKRQVEVPVDTKRIIAIGPGALRLVCYLNAQEMLVGIEHFERLRPTGRPYWLANPELASLPDIGPGGPNQINKDPHLEAVLKVKPDVIFATYMKPATAGALQKKIGIPVVILSYGTFPAFNRKIYDSIALMGKILKYETRADQVVAFIEGARKDLLRRTQGVDPAQKPTVYVGGIGFRGFQGIESTDPGYIPLEWVRARNLAKGLGKKSHVFIDREKLLIWNPEVIFVDGTGLNLVRQDFQKRPEFYKALKAFKDNRVYTLHPFIYYVANVGTAIADAYGAGKVLYPDRFQDIVPKDMANEIYTFFVGKPVYGLMAKAFGELLAPF